MKPFNHKKYLIIGILMTALNTVAYMALSATIPLIAALFQPASMAGFGFVLIPWYIVIAVAVWAVIIALYTWVLYLMKAANVQRHVRVFIIAQLVYVCLIMLPGWIFTAEETVVIEGGASETLLAVSLWFLYVFAVVMLSLYGSNAVVNRDQKR